jgi:polysaccharide export outer membrane protein
MHCCSKILQLCLVALVSALSLFSQDPVTDVDQARPQEAQPLPSSQPKTSPERLVDYILGPEDQILVRAFQAEEFPDKPIQIAGDGYINLPMVGRIHAAGLTIGGLETELSNRLRAYILHPQVTVFVSEYRSQPASVVGAVNTPGVIQLRGRKTLVEVIALAGGLRPEAGTTATITRELARGRVPLPGATDDPAQKFSVGHVNLRNVMNAQDPLGNIVIETNDVVMIPRAQLVYVVGEVEKPGGYMLNERDSMSVLQALSLAGGLKPSAAPKKGQGAHNSGEPFKAHRSGK